MDTASNKIGVVRTRDSRDGHRTRSWHAIEEWESVIFNEGLCRIAEQYLKKGSKVYLEDRIHFGSVRPAC